MKSIAKKAACILATVLLWLAALNGGPALAAFYFEGLAPFHVRSDRDTPDPRLDQSHPPDRRDLRDEESESRAKDPLARPENPRRRLPPK